MLIIVGCVGGLNIMDSGGWISVFNLGTYNIYDENDYFAVYDDSKHIASFWSKEEAQEFVIWKHYQLKESLIDEGLWPDPSAPTIDHVYRTDPYLQEMKKMLLEDLEKKMEEMAGDPRQRGIRQPGEK